MGRPLTIPRSSTVRRRGQLEKYQEKRNFAATPEPRGRTDSSAADGTRVFVVQKHEASRLHYDFRLELAGTLKSWAVPKGIPMEKGERRLAVEVEDHPLAYGEFEGTIPKGQYGGGTVMLWDQGTYEALSAHPRKDLQGGKLHFVLHGQKLEGEWALVRLKDEPNWLLMRVSPTARAISKAKDDQSVISGRSMKQISAANAVWTPRGKGAKKRAKKNIPTEDRGSSARPVRRATVPDFIAPMLAKLVEAPSPHGTWHYEVKFDGYRVLARKDDAEVALISRNGLPLTERFPSIAEAIGQLHVEQAVIDGEVVAIDAEGRSSFAALHDQDATSLIYYAFDLPWVRGHDLRAEPLEERRQELRTLLGSLAGPVRFSEQLKGDPAVLLEKAGAMGLEGLIGKRAGSRYECGQRSGAWIKLKCVRQQEFVIGGYTAPRGSRQHLGALLVGYYEGRQLRFAGKVGTGFNDRSCAELHRLLVPLGVKKPAFADPDPSLRAVHWVRPRLVCELKFTEWTRDGRLRHPVFLGLREDQKPGAVRREKPVPPPS